MIGGYEALQRQKTKWHSSIEKAMPQGTRRRRWFDLGTNGFGLILCEGWSSFWWKYKQYKSAKKLERQPEKGELFKEIHLEDWTGEKLVFPKHQKNPDVSIIIPVHNNAKYTFNCLKSILRNTKGSFEVIVVDDASEDETTDLLKNAENIRVVRNDKNRGFVESCNKGTKASEGKYLLFLNNDTIVAQNWLEPLIETLKKDKVGAVGVKLVYPDGKLQEAGGIIWKDASGWNYGRYDDPDKPEYNFVREVDYCSGATLLVRRDLFENFGGLDERFKPGYYEDTDLCFSIRKIGYKVLYQPESVVIHFEGITGGTDITSGVKKYQEINKEKFFKKWFDILEKEQYEPDSTNLFLARDRRRGKNILVIDHYVPSFDRDSGSYRMYNLLKILTELGHKVTFIGDNFARFEPYTSVLQQLGVEAVYTPYIKSIEGYLAKNGTFFDVVILSRAHIAINYISSVKKHCNKAKIVFDTVDLQFLRESRRAKIENNKRVFKEAGKMKKLEFQLARMSDVTFVVSSVEKEILLKEDPSLRIEVISNIHEVKLPKNGFSGRRDIMFLGGFVHLPNIDAVRWFVKEIFPLIKEKIPGVKFYVVGSEPPNVIKSLSSEDIIVTGYVKDLTPYFEKCRVFVAPLRYGAGVKGKINHSMSFGLPVVTTSIGAEGIRLVEGVDALVSDVPREFAEKVIELYENEDLWDKLSRNSIENIRKNYSIEVIKKELKIVFDKLDKDTETSDSLLKMREDWDKRAKENFRHYISYSETEDEFEESGRINVDDFVTKDLELITDGTEPKKMRILEIGCGAGRMTKYLGELFGEVHGVDVSDEMIRLGKNMLKSLSNVHLYRNNGSDLSMFPDNFFDFVFSFIVFQHIPEKEVIVNYIKEAHRALKSNRIFKFQVQGYLGEEYLKTKKDTWLGVSFSEDEIKEIAKSINFEIIDMKGQGTQYFWVIFKKSDVNVRKNYSYEMVS